MIDLLKAALAERPEAIARLVRHYMGLGRPFLLRSEIWDSFQTYVEEHPEEELEEGQLSRILFAAQEAAQNGSRLCVALRHQIGRWLYVAIDLDPLKAKVIPVSDYLAFKERLVAPAVNNAWTLEFDIGPFLREFPRMQESRSIGRGVEFLNRRLSSQLFFELGKGDRRLLDFLRAHSYDRHQLMVNDRIGDVGALRAALRAAEELLEAAPPNGLWRDFEPRLRQLGFEPGWGRTVDRALETIRLLSDLLEAADPGQFERFLARIPMIFSLVILSPHGFFGQENVMGRPDTGGQVVYILDQVRALEKEMRSRLEEQGLDVEPQILVVTRLIPEAEGTTCDQRIEPIRGCHSARILRVPFRFASGEVVPYWISRFGIWPYLERFTEDVEGDVLAELGGRPDLIIGNYSDGNLVATLLASKLGVTQCNIAHALEKTKYLYSDLYWSDNDPQYHFSVQFTADLIAMNSADFIITSTYQEIAGTNYSIGQYEAYASFPMPNLYRVVQGIDVFDPKFNIVSPGADAEIYFPFTQTGRRLAERQNEIRGLVLGGPDERSRGQFVQPDKPLLFTMARLDHIKNITGLVDWYGGSERLRRSANLLVVAGTVNWEESHDREEQEQIRRMHELFQHYGLDGDVRWLGLRLDKQATGELYRIIADQGGAFVQPALFEAFGLTVIEAMASGLPTFATRYGGPLEIVQHGISGFHIDPNHGDEAAELMAEFFERCAADDTYWRSISEGAVSRVHARYTWELYAERLMTLSRIYGFWKHVTNLERSEARRYLEMFYALEYRRLAAAVPH